MNDDSNSCFHTLITSLLPGLFCAVLIGAPANSEASCNQDQFTIDAIEKNGAVELHAVNSSDVPLAITLQVWTRYMTADRPRTVTDTVAPGSSRLYMVLTETDEGKGSEYGFDCASTIGSSDAKHDENQLYRLPYETGKSYYVLQGYGSRLSHTGPEEFTVDFKMPEGTAVHAARGGIVVKVEESNSIGCWKNGCGKYANYIVILHDDWTTGEYYHLQHNGALVELGEKVVAGQKIGLSGDTGNSALPHLHFGVYRAAPWGKFQSVPVQFSSADGIVRKPRRGGRYEAVSNLSSVRNHADAGDGNRSLH
jgi:murein DD-endopeptidase MepM/ murein hydrolase activator NlpD